MVPKIRVWLLAGLLISHQLNQAISTPATYTLIGLGFAVAGILYTCGTGDCRFNDSPLLPTKSAFATNLEAAARNYVIQKNGLDANVADSVIQDNPAYLADYSTGLKNDLVANLSEYGINPSAFDSYWNGLPQMTDLERIDAVDIVVSKFLMPNGGALYDLPLGYDNNEQLRYVVDNGITTANVGEYLQYPNSSNGWMLPSSASALPSSGSGPVSGGSGPVSGGPDSGGINTGTGGQASGASNSAYQAELAQVKNIQAQQDVITKAAGIDAINSAKQQLQADLVSAQDNLTAEASEEAQAAYDQAQAKVDQFNADMSDVDGFEPISY